MSKPRKRQPKTITTFRHGKRIDRRERVVIEPGVRFERWEYEQAMRGWNCDR
jgi:hypothetical protein